MNSIIDMFEESVQKYGDNTYLMEKKTDKYIDTTYKQTEQQVLDWAIAFSKLGLQSGDKVSLLSEGRNDWVLSELAVLYNGAVCVPLSVKLEEEEILFRVNHSESKYLVVSRSQLKSIEKIYTKFQYVKNIILLDDVEAKIENLVKKSDLLKTNSSDDIQNFRQTVTSKVKASDPACISYTSGTTAEPKGIVLTHRNFTANVEQALTRIYIEEKARTLLILPLDHSFAHTCGIYAFMKLGATIATVQTGSTPLQTLKNIKTNIQEVKPHVLLSVPALAKNFKKGIEEGVRKQGMGKLFDYAVNLAYGYNKEGYNRGAGYKFWVKPQMWLFDKILFSKIRNFFGGELKFFVGGGALLDIELQRFYYALGVPMFQGYGLSEATPVISTNSAATHKLGSSGKILKKMELKICDTDGKELPNFEKGEIVIKGENVMHSYYKNPEDTAKTIKNGWLHTGDMGYVDNDGYLYVLGRFKSLLISSDGEKYSPEQIEESLNEETKSIDQSMLHNNQDPYTIGLLVPNKMYLKSSIEKQKLSTDSDEAIDFAINLIKQEVDAYRAGGEKNGRFPERWLPSTFAILSEPFTEENKFLNSTMKMVRRNIADCYQQKIDFLYTPEAKNPLHEHNKEEMRKLLNS